MPYLISVRRALAQVVAPLLAPDTGGLPRPRLPGQGRGSPRMEIFPGDGCRHFQDLSVGVVRFERIEQSIRHMYGGSGHSVGIAEHHTFFFAEERGMLVVGQSAQLLLSDSQFLAGPGAKVETPGTANAPGHQHPRQVFDWCAGLFRPLLHLFHESDSQQQARIKGIDPAGAMTRP